LILTLAVGSASFIAISKDQDLSRNNQNADKLIQEAEAKAVPVEGSPSVLELKFTSSDYQILVSDAQMPMTSDEMNAFSGMDVSMPCCSFNKTVANFSENCQCGHHLATYGVIKKMVKANIPRQKTQVEVRRWISYFFPQEAIAKELQTSGLSENEINSALKVLNSKGGC
jgi:hypothetical protein